MTLKGDVQCKMLNGFKPSNPKVVQGVYFAGRAQDLMVEAELTFDDVLKTIQLGKVDELPSGRKVYEHGPTVPEYGFIDPFHSIRVFVDLDGKVEFIRGGLR